MLLREKSVHWFFLFGVLAIAASLQRQEQLQYYLHNTNIIFLLFVFVVFVFERLILRKNDIRLGDGTFCSEQAIKNQCTLIFTNIEVKVFSVRSLETPLELRKGNSIFLTLSWTSIHKFLKIHDCDYCDKLRLFWKVGHISKSASGRVFRSMNKASITAFASGVPRLSTPKVSLKDTWMPTLAFIT